MWSPGRTSSGERKAQSKSFQRSSAQAFQSDGKRTSSCRSRKSYYVSQACYFPQSPPELSKANAITRISQLQELRLRGAGPCAQGEGGSRLESGLPDCKAPCWEEPLQQVSWLRQGRPETHDNAQEDPAGMSVRTHPFQGHFLSWESPLGCSQVQTRERQTAWGFYFLTMKS